MSLHLDRGDMKLLTEAGYSGLMRGIETKLTPIFHALDVWMPQYAAGPIGFALEAMIEGRFNEADDKLAEIRKSDREGRNEATAILAMCKILQKDRFEAEKLAKDLEGNNSNAGKFAQALVHGVEEDSPEAQEVEKMAMETREP